MNTFSYFDTIEAVEHSGRSLSFVESDLGSNPIRTF